MKQDIDDNEELWGSAFREDLISLFREKLGRKDWENIVERRLRLERAPEMLSRIGNLVKWEGKKILDIGSGWGELELELSKPEYGAKEIYGLEPSETLLGLSRQLLSERPSVKIKKGVAESIPFSDDYFDIIVCYTVLEHVHDYQKSILEMIRVLRPGGKVYIFAPNYLFPKEGHYQIFFPGMFGKKIGEIYLRLLGKDPSFWNKHVRPIYSHAVISFLKRHKIKYEDIAREKYLAKGVLWKILGLSRLYTNMELVLRK